MEDRGSPWLAIQSANPKHAEICPHDVTFQRTMYYGMDTHQLESLPMLLDVFFETHYRIRKLRGKSNETSRLYRISVSNFSRFLGRPARLADLTNDNVSAHMQWMLDRGREKATANKDRSQLLALWRFATRCGLLTTFPDVAPEVEPVRVPTAWLQSDISKLLLAVDAMPGSVGDVPASLWWRTLIEVCLDTGERIGAVIQAKRDWLQGDWLLFPAEARKGGKRDRMYKLSQSTVERLAELRQHTGAELFPWPYCHNYLWKRFKAILEQAGLPAGRRDKFHRLRRTTASVVYAAGMDAQDVLDHQNKRTTQRYLDPRFTRQTQASQVLADWLRNPPAPSPDLKRRHV